jgi:hypothetical protein
MRTEQWKMRNVPFGSTAHLFGGSRNYRRTGDEPDGLGLVLTLEGLIMGIIGKKLLWRALGAANLPRLSGYDFEGLQHRAQKQVERIEAERIRGVPQAFAGTDSSE